MLPHNSPEKLLTHVGGKSWTKKQFWWYYVKHGERNSIEGGGWAPPPVDLGRVGLLEKFQKDSLVEAAVKWYKEQILKEVEKLAEEGGGQFSYENHSQTYNFTRSKWAWWKYRNDLIVLGGGLLYCDANGTVESDGSYNIQIKFSIHDWFIDVLDVRNELPDDQGSRDFDNGMPFLMIGHWYGDPMVGKLDD